MSRRVPRFAGNVEGSKLASMTEFGGGSILTVEEVGSLRVRAVVLFLPTAFRVALPKKRWASFAGPGLGENFSSKCNPALSFTICIGYPVGEQRDRAEFTATPTAWTGKAEGDAKWDRDDRSIANAIRIRCRCANPWPSGAICLTNSTPK